jgi:hypothetical protein
MSSKDEVDKLIRNLDRIPKEIKSKIIIKDIVKEVGEELKRQNRRYTSYV